MKTELMVSHGADFTQKKIATDGLFRTGQLCSFEYMVSNMPQYTL